MGDFLGALEEVKPLFGVNEEVLEDCLRGGIIRYGPQIDRILNEGQSFVEQVRQGKTLLHSVLLHGPRGSGKTALAAQIALSSQFPFIKIVRAYDMVGMNEMQKIQHLSKVFTDAYKSPLNVLVLDNIELLLDWVAVGPRFSASVLSALKGLMEHSPPKARPLLIIGTTSNRTVTQQLELAFNEEIPVPNLQNQQELAHVMSQSGEFDQQEIQRVLAEIGETTGTQSVGVGIRRILLGIQTAMQAQDKGARFAELMCRYINDTR